MNPKKQKEKERRRARKLAEQAWEAVAVDNLDLAEKIIHRAVAAQPDNPVLWTDQGIVLGLRQKDAEAAESFRTAISLAPTFAEPYAHLATQRSRLGYLKEAVALQAQAVKHAPQNLVYSERLVAYRSLAGRIDLPAMIPPATGEPRRSSFDQTADEPAEGHDNEWREQLAMLNWHEFGERLTNDGCVLIPGLVDAAICARLCEMFEDNALFAKTVVMDRAEFGLGVYRYFRAPIPSVVDQLRRSVYPYAARIANGWQRLLGEPECYSTNWNAFSDECRRAGQSTSTPILLKYGPGGFNALHRDIRGNVYFPIQMAVVLSPRADPSDSRATGFRGGEFLLCDVPETKKSRRRQLAAGLGDAVLFCTCDRLAPVGGAYGLQPVKHGVAPITTGERFVLGLPFHEYR